MRGAGFFVLIGLVAANALAAPPPPAPVDAEIVPGFSADPVPVLPQPRHDAPLDPVTVQLIVARLVRLHALDRPADAQDPAKLADAVRAVQAGMGIKATGLLDRHTIALLAL
jgi:hypothetical protein